MSVRPSWDEYGLALAHTAATRADCTRSKVGAVLMNSQHEVRGVAYNGAPSGVPGCGSAGACPRGKHAPKLVMQGTVCACGKAWPCQDASAPGSDYANCIADHAERNAIRHTPSAELPGATLYTTREPCAACWTLIRACGIARVVTPETDYARP